MGGTKMKMMDRLYNSSKFSANKNFLERSAGIFSASEGQNRLLHRLHWFLKLPANENFPSEVYCRFLYRTFVFRNAQNQILHRIFLAFKFPEKNKIFFKIS